MAGRTDCRKAFTLVELLIVIAVIAIIAAIVVPGMLRSKAMANETSAITSLKNMCSAQEGFKTTCCVDINANGCGEYGFLGEVSGVFNYRENNAGGLSGESCSSNPFVDSSFANVNANHETLKSGYFFICYLPTGLNGGTPQHPQPVDVLLSEDRYVIYAFPNRFGRSGSRVFAITPLVIPYSWPNAAATYAKTGNAPPWNAALGDTNGDGSNNWHDNIDQGGPGTTAVPGQNWVQVS